MNVKRIVTNEDNVCIEPQKSECPWQGIIMIPRTWQFSPRVISGLVSL